METMGNIQPRALLPGSVSRRCAAPGASFVSYAYDPSRQRLNTLIS